MASYEVELMETLMLTSVNPLGSLMASYEVELMETSKQKQPIMLTRKMLMASYEVELMETRYPRPSH